MPKKILIFYTAIGQGHKVMAENIAWWLTSLGHEVVLKDALRTQGGWLAKLGEKLYLKILDSVPWVWHWLYNSKLLLPLRFLRAPLAGQNSDKILQTILEEKPDAVITTQITASSALSYLRSKKKWTGFWATSFSDYHFHPYWFFPEADAALTNISEQGEVMQRMGYDQSRIFCVGLSLQPRREYSAVEVKSKYEVPENNNIILISGGSLGYGLDIDLIKSLAQEVSGRNVTVVVMCGTNEKFAEELRSQNFPQVKVLGFVSASELYSVAKVLVGKPGGLTVAECLRDGVKIFVTTAMPGQELANIQYLQKRGLIQLLLGTPKNTWPVQIVAVLDHMGTEVGGQDLAGQDLEKLYTKFIEQI